MAFIAHCVRRPGPAQFAVCGCSWPEADFGLPSINANTVNIHFRRADFNYLPAKSKG
jgi:hypothetical protein